MMIENQLLVYYFVYILCEFPFHIHLLQYVIHADIMLYIIFSLQPYIELSVDTSNGEQLLLVQPHF